MIAIGRRAKPALVGSRGQCRRHGNFAGHLPR